MITEERKKHIFAVAELMKSKALDMGLSDSESNEMYTLGLLHDVGYEFGENNTEHPRLGAAVLERLGYKHFKAVEDHGNPDAKFTPELLLLNFADQSIDHLGINVGSERRVESIGERYGKDSKAYKDAVRLKIKLDEELSKLEMK